MDWLQQYIAAQNVRFFVTEKASAFNEYHNICFHGEIRKI